MKRITKGRAILVLPTAWCKLIFLLFFLFSHCLYFSGNKYPIHQYFFISNSIFMNFSKASGVHISEGINYISEIHTNVNRRSVEKKELINLLNKKNKRILAKLTTKVNHFSLRFIFFMITENEFIFIVGIIKLLLKVITFFVLLFYSLFFGLQLFFKSLNRVCSNFEFYFFKRVFLL